MPEKGYRVAPILIYFDTLNILLIINEDFLRASEIILNPVNSYYISKNDGKFNADYGHQRDAVIQMNSLVQIARGNYSNKQMKIINQIKSSV